MGSLTRIGMTVAALALIAARPVPAPTPATPPTPSIRLGVEKWRAGAWSEAVTIWQPFAAAGEPNALFNMGQAYKLGRGVTADPATARDYYRKAAAKGHLAAQANLGISLYQAGDKLEAARWLRMAADRGEARAQYVLGIALYNGDGVTRNPGLGYGYLLRSAASGLAQASTALAGIEGVLGPNDRQVGETVAASLAAGTGVPPAYAMVTGPRLITAPLPPSTTLLKASPALPPPPLIRAAPPPTVPFSIVTPLPAKIPIVVVPPAAPDAGIAIAGKPPEPARAAGVTIVSPVAVAPSAKLPEISKPVQTVEVAKPVEPATVPKPRPAGWRVQLGAFSQRRLADEAWAAVQRGGSLGDGVKPVFATDGSVTKLQLGPYASREAARSACAKLSEGGRACFVTAG